jgi:hypothetical protein
MKMQLFKRASSRFPLAFSVQPSDHFDEDDGLWNTFNLAVGAGSNGPQNFRVVVSTSSYDLWLPQSPVCPLSSLAPSDCPSSRGVGFYNNKLSDGYNGTRSTTQEGPLGIEVLALGGELDIETLFGTAPTDYANVSGSFWVDYIHLNSPTAPITTLDSPKQIPILGYSRVPYYLATLGLGVGRHISTAKKIVNSTVMSMSDAGVIPSRSWGYTAGAYYGQYLLF